MPFSPVITTSAIPGIEVTMLGITYNEFVNSLMAIQYKINNIFLEAEGNNQLSQTYTYFVIDGNGEGSQYPLKPKVDPYQSQPSLKQDINNPLFIFNGLSYLTFILLAGQTLSMELCSDTVQFEPKGDRLDVLGPYEKMITCL